MILDHCPYCENLDKFGLLPARQVTFDVSRNDLPGLNYGERKRVTSLVHPDKNQSRLMAGVRCHHDTYAAGRIAEDATKPLEAVEPVA